MSEDRPHGSRSRSERDDRYRAALQELQELQRRMAAIEQEVADEVDRNRTSSGAPTRCSTSR